MARTGPATSAGRETQPVRLWHAAATVLCPCPGSDFTDAPTPQAEPRSTLGIAAISIFASAIESLLTRGMPRRRGVSPKSRQMHGPDAAKLRGREGGCHL